MGFVDRICIGRIHDHCYGWDAHGWDIQRCGHLLSGHYLSFTCVRLRRSITTSMVWKTDGRVPTIHFPMVLASILMENTSLLKYRLPYIDVQLFDSIQNGWLCKSNVCIVVLEGSNDNSDWSILDTRVSDPTWSVGEDARVMSPLIKHIKCIVGV